MIVTSMFSFLVGWWSPEFHLGSRTVLERNHDLSELVTKLEDALYFALDGRGSSPAQVKELIHH
jgi:hypothetical protein